MQSIFLIALLTSFNSCFESSKKINELVPNFSSFAISKIFFDFRFQLIFFITKS